jgi:hypothetical protein
MDENGINQQGLNIRMSSREHEIENSLLVNIKSTGMLVSLQK